MHQFYLAVVEILLRSIAAKGRNLGLLLVQCFGIALFGGVGQGRMSHHLSSCYRRIKGNGPEEIHVYFALVGNTEKCAGFQEVRVLHPINLCHYPGLFGLVSAGFSGKRPWHAGDLFRLKRKAYSRNLKTSGQLAYYKVYSGEAVYMFV